MNQIRSVPGLDVVFRSNGLGNADQTLIDDGVENMSESTRMVTGDGIKDKEGEDEDSIQVEQICIANVGQQEYSRPYMTVSRPA